MRGEEGTREVAKKRRFDRGPFRNFVKKPGLEKWKEIGKSMLREITDTWRIYEKVYQVAKVHGVDNPRSDIKILALHHVSLLVNVDWSFPEPSD